MAFITANGGVSSADVDSSGLRAGSEGDVVTADMFNLPNLDLQSPPMYSDLPGVLSGGVCTAALLVVTVPDQTRYFARVVWIADGGQTISVPDSAVTYIWGCADGLLRTSAAAATAPTGWTDRTSCLLTKATASGGTVTLDNTVQWRARFADSAARTVTDGPMMHDYATGRSTAARLVIPILTSDPSSPVTGEIWYRSDLNQLSFRNGGTTKRSGTFS